MNPVPLLLGFMVGSPFAIHRGFVIARSGIRGIRARKFPLTDHQDLHGTGAVIAGSFTVALGLLAIASGLAIFTFCAWRLYEINHAPARH
jgi:hypothetical protein